MRWNALLKSVEYAIRVFPDGRISAPAESISGYDLSECSYAGYDAKAAMYLMDTPHGRYEFENWSAKKHVWPEDVRYPDSITLSAPKLTV
ncbi:hypothetical protein D9M68_828640 [compost metagenome]